MRNDETFTTYNIEAFATKKYVVVVRFGNELLPIGEYDTETEAYELMKEVGGSTLIRR